MQGSVEIEHMFTNELARFEWLDSCPRRWSLWSPSREKMGRDNAWCSAGGYFRRILNKTLGLAPASAATWNGHWLVRGMWSQCWIFDSCYRWLHWILSQDWIYMQTTCVTLLISAAAKATSAKPTDSDRLSFESRSTDTKLASYWRSYVALKLPCCRNSLRKCQVVTRSYAILLRSQIVLPSRHVCDMKCSFIARAPPFVR